MPSGFLSVRPQRRRDKTGLVSDRALMIAARVKQDICKESWLSATEIEAMSVGAGRPRNNSDRDVVRASSGAMDPLRRRVPLKAGTTNAKTPARCISSVRAFSRRVTFAFFLFPV